MITAATPFTSLRGMSNDVEYIYVRGKGWLPTPVLWFAALLTKTGKYVSVTQRKPEVGEAFFGLSPTDKYWNIGEADPFNERRILPGTGRVNPDRIKEHVASFDWNQTPPWDEGHERDNYYKEYATVLFVVTPL